ncbi:MAG: TlpA disulfide reductase family protein [bacterium]
MKYLMFLLLLFSFINNSSSEQEITKSIVNDVVELYKSHQSISYSVDFKFKSIMDNDTFKISGDCLLIKVSPENQLRKQFWYKDNLGNEVFSFLSNSFYIHTDKKLIYKFSEDNHQELFLSNIMSNLIQIYFFNPEKLISLINDTSNRTNFEIINIDNKEFWKIKLKSPDQNEVSERQKNILIDKESLLIKGIESMLKVNDEYQSQQIILKNIRFDALGINYMENRFDSLSQIFTFIDGDSITRANNQSAETKKPIEKVPSFNGYDYVQNKVVKLIEFKSKIILLDFWYLSCPPCIQAIPMINDLYKKYKKQDLVVIGINSKDNPKENSHLDNFIKKKNISYPLLFVDKSVDSLYQVKAYPTLYLIDKKGKVIYYSVGWNESEIDSLEFHIKKYLKIK